MVLFKEIYLITIVVITKANFSHESMMEENSVIDLNDILSEKLMPASLFFMDHSIEEDGVSEFRTLDNDTRIDTTIYDGTFNNAYSTMGYHRKMIKEYMCSNFLAEQILNDVAPAHFQSRVGLSALRPSNITESRHKTSRALKASGIQESMRYDQGSTGYKDWLSKTATMEDIYRHIIMSPTAANDSLISSTLLTNSDDVRKVSTRRQDKNDENEYEEGDVTGYAMQHPGLMNSNEGIGSQMNLNPLMENMQNYGIPTNHIAGNKIEYPSEIYNQNAYSLNDDQSNLLLYNQYLEQMKAAHEHHYKHPVRHANTFTSLKEKFKKLFSGHKTEHEHEGYDHSGYGAQSYDKGSKEMGLKDLFDIALTTLAFLSFGMFILQVLMCITMSKTDNNNLMMMPMEVETMNPEVEEVRRKRRSSETSTIIEMNDVSHKILLSIEAVLIAHKDDGKCLLNVICENNKYSRDLNNNQKLWIPVWSLGLSWLSSRIIPGKSYSSILESLKASAFGLGRADCLRLFPCDTDLQRKLRKTRRKTRQANNHIFEWNI